MGKKKKNYKVKESDGKKYTGNKNQKVASRQKNDKSKTQPSKESIKDDSKLVESTNEIKEPNRIEELKSQIEKLQAEKRAYYEGAKKGESEIVAAERKDTNSIERTKIDVEIYRLQKELRDLLSKENENAKNQEVKDNKPEAIESPEVKALKSQISDLDNRISSEEWVLRNNEGDYLPEELEQIKAGIENLKAQRDEVSGKLNDLEKGLKGVENKEKSEDDKSKAESEKDSENKQSENKDKSEDKEKNKDKAENDKSKNPEMVTYKVGPFKRLLMSIIRKIKSWAKADGRIARLCDKAEGAVIGKATPLLEGAADDKEIKKSLNLGKVKDLENEVKKDIADAKNAKYDKDKYEQAEDHEETKKKLDLEDMEFIKSKIVEADKDKKEGKEESLMAKMLKREYKKVLDEYGTDDGFDDKKIDQFVKANNIPAATKKNVMNITLWNTSKVITETAKEKGIVVNEGKGKNANARPLSEIYAALEARVKTDRVSREANEKTEKELKENKAKDSNLKDVLDK